MEPIPESGRGIIYTFYSYKGGVGRSMALANAADLLYQLGLKVLMVDWNLEAPGLERYFPVDLDKALTQRGLINLLLQYKENMAKVLDEGQLPFEDPETYLIDVYPQMESGGRLQLLTAGQRSGATDFAGYSEQVRDFDWSDFYEDWEAAIYFDWLRQQFQKRADVILIDSRTGVAEMEGDSTYQFPDVLVLFCSSNMQSLDGISQIARSFVSPIAERRRKGRPLKMLFIPSRIEDRADAPLVDAFRDKFLEIVGSESLKPFFSSQLADNPDLQWDLKIPYVPFYAFAETVAVRDSAPQGGNVLAGAYANLLIAMAHLAPVDGPPGNPSYEALTRAVTLLEAPGALSSALPVDKDINAPPFNPPLPYPGMSPYTAENGHFYGRAAETRRMVQHLRNSRLLLLIGPSSSGKSSLLQAGLEPAITSSAYWPPGYWAVLNMRRTIDPVRTLSELLGDDLSDPARAVDAWLKSHQPAQRLLLIIDQLEELLIQDDAQLREEFIAIINKLRQSENCAVVMSLRSDMYSDLIASDLWPVSEGDRLEITPLTDDNLRKAIRQPALDVGVTIEPALVERLVADSANEPGRLPLLQETLLVLWDSIDRRRIPLSAYEKLGGPGVTGLAAVVDKKADKIWAELAPEQQKIARRIFIRLVQFGFGRPDTRRQQFTSELQADGDNPQQFENTLAALANGRLLVLGIQKASEGEMTGDKTTVDIAHDALIQGWRTLHGWVSDLETRDNERTRRRLEERAGKWAESGKSSSGLLNLTDSQVAEEWLKSQDAQELGYSSLLAELVAASREAWEADRKAREAAKQRELKQAQLLARQRKRAIGMLATLLALVIILAGVAIWLGQRAEKSERVAQARALAKQSIAELDRDPEVSLLLAMEAVSKTQSSGERFIPEAEDALHQALLNSRVRQRFVVEQEPNKTPGTSITGVAYRPDKCQDLMSQECYVVTTDAKGVIRVWRSSDGQLVKSFQHSKNIISDCVSEEPEKINNVSFSGDGRFIITAGNDCTAEVWPAEQFWKSGTIKLTTAITLTRTKQIWNAALNEDGSKAVIASGDGRAKVWNMSPVLPTFGITSTFVLTPSEDITSTTRLECDKPDRDLTSTLQGVADVAFSPDGRYIATASADHRAMLWDANTGRRISKLIGHCGTVWSVAFSPLTSTMLLATSSDDGKVMLWDLSKAETMTETTETKPIRTWILPLSNNGLNRAGFSPDGRYLFAVSDGHQATIWDLAKGKEIVTLLGHSGPVHAAAFSMDQSRIATASGDGTVRVWDWNTSGGEELPALEVSTIITQGIGINNVSFKPKDKNNPDGNEEVVTANDDGRVTVWELIRGSSGITATVRQIYTATQHTARVNTAVYSPDGKSILTASDDRTVKIWNPEEHTFHSPIDVHRNKVLSAAYSSDGKRIITARDRVFNKDGDIISPSTAIVWDIDPKNQAKYKPTYLWLPPPYPITCAIFDPTGNQVATCSDDLGPGGYLSIWDVSSAALTGRTFITTPITTKVGHYGPVTAADWDEKNGIVTTGVDWSVNIWKGSLPLETPQTLTGHLGTVTSATFSKDSKKLATTSTDGTTRVWDTDNFDKTVMLKGHAGHVRAVTFSPDGKIVATAGEDGTVRLYLNDINLLMLLAESRAIRPLTPEEKAAYLGIPLPSPTPLPRP
ncbi:MAG TPA: AAA family ATPase [Chloroflexia bacterium]|nr:AAA family ATPase [Chloroflexia bacterium]